MKTDASAALVSAFATVTLSTAALAQGGAAVEAKKAIASDRIVEQANRRLQDRDL